MANFVEMTDGTSDALAVPGEPGYQELLDAGFVHTCDYKAPVKAETPKAAKVETAKTEPAKAETVTQEKTKGDKSAL